MNINVYMYMWKEVIFFIFLEEVYGIKFRNCRLM